jgi:hypothetical protein
MELVVAILSSALLKIYYKSKDEEQDEFIRVENDEETSVEGKF